jgi:hypothetical protein
MYMSLPNWIYVVIVATNFAPTHFQLALYSQSIRYQIAFNSHSAKDHAHAFLLVVLFFTQHIHVPFYVWCRYGRHLWSNMEMSIVAHVYCRHLPRKHGSHLLSDRVTWEWIYDCYFLFLSFFSSMYIKTYYRNSMYFYFYLMYHWKYIHKTLFKTSLLEKEGNSFIFWCIICTSRIAANMEAKMGVNPVNIYYP